MLVGGVGVFVVAFTLLESLVGTKPTGSTSAQDSIASTSPAPPEVLRPEGGGVEIRLDFFRRSRYRLGNEDQEQALFDCLTKKIEEKFAAGTEGWDHQRVRDETQRIQEECMDLQDIPVPPRPLRPLRPPDGDG
jgi:hypothetical protein